MRVGWWVAFDAMVTILVVGLVWVQLAGQGILMVTNQYVTLDSAIEKCLYRCRCRFL